MPQLHTCGTQDPRPIRRPFFGGTHQNKPSAYLETSFWSTHQNKPSIYSETSFWWHPPKQTLNLFEDLFLVAPTKMNC